MAVYLKVVSQFEHLAVRILILFGKHSQEHAHPFLLRQGDCSQRINPGSQTANSAIPL
jgi:hypothetical protein